MATPPVELTPAVIEAARLAHEAGEPYTVIGRRLGHSPDKIRGRVVRALQGTAVPQGPPVKLASPETEQRTSSDGGVTLIVKDLPRIRTVEEVLAAGGLDPVEWTVQKANLKNYEGFMKSADDHPVVVPLTSAHVTLAPNNPARAAITAIEEMKADLLAFVPRYTPIQYARIPDGQRFMLEACLFDVHLGMLAWAAEAGNDYDVQIATDMLAEVVDRLVAAASSNRSFDRVLLPLGNDWLHADTTIDGKGGATTRGTPQDVDTRWPRLIRMARSAAIRAIDRLRQVAPVTVIIKPGNHDSERMFHLGEQLDIWYRFDEAVTVINEPKARTYFRYGTTLLGFTHGHLERQADLPLIMANEAKEDWAATTHHEWHVGHRHRKGEAVPVAEYSKCRVRTMPSLAPADAWHAGKGYDHVRAAEAYIWGFDQGYAGHVSENAELIQLPAPARRSKRRRAA